MTSRFIEQTTNSIFFNYIFSANIVLHNLDASHVYSRYIVH